MLLTGDYHTHTIYSHGKETVLENAERAKQLGIKQLGISDSLTGILSSIIEFLQIYLSRMRMCEEAAAYLNCVFRLVINGMTVNQTREFAQNKGVVIDE